MSENPASPLLREGDDEPNRSQSRSQTSRDTSPRKNNSKQSTAINSDEATPLLSRVDGVSYGDEILEEDGDTIAAAESSGLDEDDDDNLKRRSRCRWPIIAALTTLLIVVIVILCLGFAAPSAMEQYVQQAAVFEPQDLSIEEFTDHGVKARVKGNFRLDGSRVSKKSVRDLGRAGTWLVGGVESRPTSVEISLPEYGNVVLAQVEMPHIVVSLKDGEVTHIDILTEVIPSAIAGLKNVAIDWMEGRLGQLRIQAKADVRLKSGIFSLPTQSILTALTFENKDIPAVPKYSIDKINVHELDLPGSKGMSADVSISVPNDYPITFTVPPLAFEILVPGCTEGEQFLQLANATTKEIDVSPKHTVHVDGQGIVRQLSETLVAHCPGSDKSPLDTILGAYISGHETIMFVRGADYLGRSPDWISELTKSVMVPVPLTGRSMGKLIRNFTMADVSFGLPDPMAEPDSREAQPIVSATVKVVVNVPEEMNFPIDVSRVKSKPNVFYNGKKLGVLDLNKWRPATSQRLDGSATEKPGILIETVLKKAPIWITDQDVFSSVIQKMIFGGAVTLSVKAAVDIEVETAIGKFRVRDIPAEGEVPIHPLPSGGGGVGDHLPKVGDLSVIETSSTSVVIEVKTDVTNPTNYSATIPYVNINIMSNGSVLAQAYAEGLNIVPGLNKNVVARGKFSPYEYSGEEGVAQARELLSQYLSNYNTSLTFATHRGTFPSNPQLGSTLSKLKIDVPTPKLGGPDKPKKPGDDEDPKHPRFVRDATMHILTSTATFTLDSPLKHTTIFATYLNVTAFYNHTEPVGHIEYDIPLVIPPGTSETPPLPVDWSLDSIGYDAVRDALGGALKLDSRATIDLAIGKYKQSVWYEGQGINAKVRI